MYLKQFVLEDESVLFMTLVESIHQNILVFFKLNSVSI